MKTMKFQSTAGLLSGLLLSFAGNLTAQESTDIQWSDYTGYTRGGQSLEGRLGRIQLPENRSKQNGKTIELAFVVYESTNPYPGPPIFYLIGGPGAPGVEYTAEEALNPLLPLLEIGDVIGIDQRGTGNSKPNLSNGGNFSFALPFNQAMTRDTLLAAQTDAMSRCYQHWIDQGIDLAAYNSNESADDVDAVRQALGYDKIITWGTSYGTHLSLAYLRRHSEHVARSVLMKVEGPDHTFKLPSKVQRQLEILDERMQETFPGLLEKIQLLLSQLEEEPVVVKLQPPGRDEISIELGPYDLQCSLALQITHTQSIVRLPEFLGQLVQGDWSLLARSSLNLRHGGADSAMAFMMDYSSGASKKRHKQLERELKDPANLIGDALSYPYFPESSSAIGDPDLGNKFRSRLKCDVPTLFVSGDLDARTPPSNAEEVMVGFKNATHILVKGTGHDSRELESPQYRNLVMGFLYGEEIESCTIELPPIEFASSGR